MEIISWDEFQRQKKGEYEMTITPDQLHLGDWVVRTDPDRLADDPAAPAGRVDSFDQKNWYRQHCRRVTIDLNRCLSRKVSAGDASLARIGALPAIGSGLDALRRSRITAKNLVEAWAVYRELSQVAQAQMLSFHRHGRIDIASAEEAIDELLERLEPLLAPMMWLARIKEASRYVFQHNLNCAILAAGFAQAAGWEAKIIRAVALAGLVHDLGMVRVSLEVIRKPGPLSAAEQIHLQLHTRLAFELLSQHDGVADAVARTALCHHERPDGEGYPEGLTLQGIPSLARLIAVVSAYEAMTSNRFHRRAISHHQALRELQRLRGKQFDSTYAEAFARFLGGGRLGNLIRLADGRLSIALHSPGSAKYPLVRLLKHVGDGFQMGAEIDLANDPAYQDNEQRRHHTLADGASGVQLRALTRQLPTALAATQRHSTASADGDPPVRRERRRRPRLDAPRGTHILVIDDSKTIRETLRNMFEPVGYRVSVAETAIEGLEQAAADPPDLVFLDIVLPDLSGFRALRRLRRNRETEQLPVVMISGDAGAIEKFFLQRVGADDFLSKPFGRVELFAAIERLIRSGALAERAVG